MVATGNRSTANRDLLQNDDFLGNPGNRVLVYYPPGTTPEVFEEDSEGETAGPDNLTFL